MGRILIITMPARRNVQEGETLHLLGATWLVLELLPSAAGEHKMIAERVDDAA